MMKIINWRRGLFDIVYCLKAWWLTWRRYSDQWNSDVYSNWWSDDLKKVWWLFDVMTVTDDWNTRESWPPLQWRAVHSPLLYSNLKEFWNYIDDESIQLFQCVKVMAWLACENSYDPPNDSQIQLTDPTMPDLWRGLSAVWHSVSHHWPGQPEEMKADVWPVLVCLVIRLASRNDPAIDDNGDGWRDSIQWWLVTMTVFREMTWPASMWRRYIGIDDRYCWLWRWWRNVCWWADSRYNRLTEAVDEEDSWPADIGKLTQPIERHCWRKWRISDWRKWPALAY